MNHLVPLPPEFPPETPLRRWLQRVALSVAGLAVVVLIAGAGYRYLASHHGPSHGAPSAP